MENQLKICPIISAKEYDKCYFLIHRAYSHFFGDINNINELPTYNKENFYKIRKCINKIDFSSDEKEYKKLINQFRKLKHCKNNDNFIEKSIKEYISESSFCYLFNRIMRNFEKELVQFAYFMGPFLYGLNKYLKYNPSFALSKDMKLYRIIQCSEIEFHQYTLHLGHIICFPSLTSTSSEPIYFIPTMLAKKNNNEDKQKVIKIKMIFNYIHKKGNISPGIIIENKKNKDGIHLSSHPNEKEVILFPFTFAKITNIKSEIEKGNEIKIIEFEIINRNSYIEYTLRDKVKKRFLFSKLDN